jgi:hypothetical protein
MNGAPEVPISHFSSGTESFSLVFFLNGRVVARLNPGVHGNLHQTRLPTQRKIVDLLPGYIEIDSLRIPALDCTKR